MPINREEFDRLKPVEKKGSSLERKVESLFQSKGFQVERNAKKRGQSGTLHEIDVLATYNTPLYKSIVLIECKDHENHIGKEIVMKLESVIRDIGADKGIIISSGGFTSGALSYARNLNIELWTRERFNKEVEKSGNKEISINKFETQDNETMLDVYESGFDSDVRNTFRIYFLVRNDSSQTIRNVNAKINLLDVNGRILDSKNRRLGTMRPEMVERPTIRFNTYYGELRIEIILFSDEIECGREIFNYKINKPMCFIATAAYGTPFAEEINVLRYWRDTNLNKNTYGRLFIRVYYVISPPLAVIISKSNILRKIVRMSLSPLIKVLKGREARPS